MGFAGAGLIATFGMKEIILHLNTDENWGFQNPVGAATDAEMGVQAAPGNDVEKQEEPRPEAPKEESGAIEHTTLVA